MLFSQFPPPSPSRCVHSLFCPHLHLTSDETTANRKVSTKPGAQMQSQRELKAGSMQPDQDGKLWAFRGLRLVALLLVIRAEAPPPHAQSIFLSSLQALSPFSLTPELKCLLALNITRGRHDFGLGCALLGRFLQLLAKLLFIEADGSSCEMESH